MVEKLKVLRTDNGMEFCSGDFNSFCRKEGIVRHHTIPYTPQQNGVAERMNRTIISKARCMLSNSGLSRNFVRDIIEKGLVKVCKISTHNNPADMMTKHVSVAKFELCSNLVGIIN
jgi:transposase InsO family protein